MLSTKTMQSILLIFVTLILLAANCDSKSLSRHRRSADHIFSSERGRRMQNQARKVLVEALLKGVNGGEYELVHAQNGPPVPPSFSLPESFDQKSSNRLRVSKEIDLKDYKANGFTIEVNTEAPIHIADEVRNSRVKTVSRKMILELCLDIRRRYKKMNIHVECSYGGY